MIANKAKIGWGILGPGAIARQFAHCLALLDDAYIAAVGSRTLEHAEEFCKEYGGKAYGSYEELCEDPDVDIIYVATPHPFHEQHVIMACNHGKNVLCEKPFAVNHDQAERMVEAARRNNVFLQEGLWSRFFPAWQYIRKEIDSGRFGRLRQVRCATCWGMTDDDIDIKGRLMNPELAGGSLLDAGFYSLAAMTFARGKYDYPTSFSSHMQFEKLTPVDSDVDMMMLFEDGFSAYLQSSFHRNDQQCDLICENTTITIPINRNPSRIYIRDNPPFWAFWSPNHAPGMNLEEARRAHMRSLPFSERRGYTTAGGDLTALDFPYEAEGFQFEAESVQECLRTGLKENPQAPLEETLLISAIADEARRQGGLKYPFED